MLVVQHSVTEEMAHARDQIFATIQAVQRFQMPKIWVMPNNDAGSDVVRNTILKERNSDSQIFANLRREDYLGFMKLARCIVGNSSSGLLEAPTFKVPAVNLGRRQAMRVSGANVINSSFEVEEIVKAIELAISDKFRDSLKNMVNPYGDGCSSSRILDILQKSQRNEKLLIKQLTY